MNPFRSLRDYEEFVYTVRQIFPSVKNSDLVVIPRGRLTAVLCHPNDPFLQSSHPHHKHIPPNIKSNRIPAPLLSFTQPNLPVFIQEIEELVRNEKPV
ncbi:hypothetical protein QUF76_16020 [Desulfobacterales bacterium HSG16]|nr:hypothetical protein [Desulfobacterales bacterium HSG16]